MTDTNGRAGRSDAAGSRKGATDGPVIIKKYANRRLYNTASSSYVTLDNWAEMVRQGTDFIVYDAKTNDDITRSVLAQIIFEEEGRGQNLLPQQFLRQLIRLYGDSMQAFIPGYLEASLDGFAREQEKLRKEFSAGAGGAEAYKAFQNQVRQNLAMVDQAMRMFTPFAYVRPDAAGAKPEAAAEPAPEPSAGGGDALAEMKAQLEAMQRQIADLASKK
jgi:polyhydroxyalkanoate synthesis repressor PhaR